MSLLSSFSFSGKGTGGKPRNKAAGKVREKDYSSKIGIFRELPRMEFMIPWCFVDDATGVVYNVDNSMFSVLAFRGPDMDSATAAEMCQYMAAVNNSIKKLGTGFVLYFDAQRHKAMNYDKSEMPTALLQEMENERQAYYNSETAHYETNFYFIIYHEPPAMLRKKIADMFVRESRDRRNGKADAAEEDLKVYKKAVMDFRNSVTQIYEMLKNWFKDLHLLNAEETLAYLHNTISDHRMNKVAVNNSRFIKDYLCDSSLLAGREPKLGKKYMKVITILNFPPASTPGLLNNFNFQPFEYRWVSRFICLSKLDAQKELQNYQQRWSQQVKSMFTQIKEAAFPSTKGDDAVNETAIKNAEDASDALLELGEDAVSYGYYTMTMFVFDENKDRCDALAARILEIINTMGFTGYIETDNSIEAWRGSLPGCYKCNIRRPIINSLNFCHLAPATSTWSGDKKNNCLKAPVLLYTDSSGFTPFRLCLHVGDLGHTMVVGPSGSGKSVFLNTIEAHFMKYKDSNVFIFDKAASSRAMTLAVGGNFYNLAAEGKTELSFQPFAHIEDDTEAKWAKEWIMTYMKQKGMKATPIEENYVWKALMSLRQMPKHYRTISGFCQLVQDEGIRQAMQGLTNNGSYGTLFDNSEDFSGEGRWQVYEMETIMNTPSIVPPTLDYLFHRIEGRLKHATGPSIIVLDECWLFFDNPAFRNKLREYFKDMRKKNTSIIFATQNLADVANKADLLSTVMENCPNRIYLPNVNATNEQNSKMYHMFGCNDRQIELISEMTPKQDYYYSCEQKGNRVFRLSLNAAELPFVTATNKTDQAAMNQIINAGKKKDFIHQWLEYKKADPAVWKNITRLIQEGHPAVL